MLRGYVVRVYNTNTTDTEDVAYTATYLLEYRKGDSYQETSTTLTSTPSPPGPASTSTSRAA